MNLYYSALGIVTGTVYFALSGHGPLVVTIACLIASTLAFTNLRKHKLKIFSFLSFFLLMFFSFQAREEYFEYFAKKRVETKAGQVFRIVESKSSAFFTETFYLKPYSKYFKDQYLNPKLVWKIANIKGLKKNDLVSFKSKLEIKDLSPKEKQYLRSKKVFQKLKNKDFEYLGHETSQIQKIQEQIKRFYREHLKPKNAELALGLILGSRNADIDNNNLKNIRNLGLGHFFSASGFHLITLILLIFWIFELLTKAQLAKFKKLRGFTSILAVFAYMALTNFTPSILRAGLMAITFLIFKNSNRKIDSVKLLIMLAAVVLLIDPHTVFDLGFQFSYLATLGILIWFQDINSYLESKLTIKWFREILALSLSVQILLFPLIIYYFSNAQVWSLLANLIFSPILALITMLSFTGIYFLLDPLLSALSYIFNASQKLPWIDLRLDLDLTSLILLWVFLNLLAVFLFKDFQTDRNVLVNAFKNKKMQLAFSGSALMLFLGTNLPSLKVEKLEVHKGALSHKNYSSFFKTGNDFEYFKIKKHKALVINKLSSVEKISENLQEVNFLFLPKLSSNFNYLSRLIELTKPQVTIIHSKSQAPKTLENIELIASRSNTIIDDGKIYISKDKFWSIK